MSARPTIDVEQPVARGAGSHRAPLITRMPFLLCVLCSFLCVLGTAGEAQMRRPRAEVTPLVERSGVRPGESARAALRVSLPDGLHTQSNKPRDETLIPTELTIDAPPGVTVKEIVWPPATDLNQAGSEKPLAVFEQTFAIGVELALAPSVPAGDLVVPVRLRYQACDSNLCYPPANADVQWTILVTGMTIESKPDPVFATIAWGHGEAPMSAVRQPGPNGAGAARGASGSAAAKLDSFVILGTTFGYQGSSDFLKFIHNAENGVKERGLFEGRGPLAILLIVLIGGLALNLTPCVLPMIPINLAIIGAGTQVGLGEGFPSRARGFLLGATYGGAMALVYGVLGLVVVLTAGTFGTINASPWFNLGIAALFVVLGLAMFDVIMIDFSTFSSRLVPGANTGTFV